MKLTDQQLAEIARLAGPEGEHETKFRSKTVRALLADLEEAEEERRGINVAYIGCLAANKTLTDELAAQLEQARTEAAESERIACFRRYSVSIEHAYKGSIEDAAHLFATAAHAAAGNIRKYTGEPYINHPAAVVELVRTVQHTPEMLAAAWLHDTVEDTGVTLELIECEFGAAVAKLVEMLTDVSHANDGLRTHRKAKDREHTAKASPAAKTIKLADLIDNTRSIVEHDPEFAKIYMAEKALLLEVLRDGDPALWKHAHDILDTYRQSSRKDGTQ